MEFNQKLQELRKQKGLTQEELAEKLYVSRTAISKWESGRGYPNIDSLKAIATFFSVTVDELLSPTAVLTIAEEDKKQTKKHFRDLSFGLLDVCSILLLFLPLFAARTADTVTEASLLTLDGVKIYLLIAYFVAVIGTTLAGILILSLHNCEMSAWLKIKSKLSLALGTFSTLLFMISLQPYAAVFMFSLLLIKIIILIKWQ